VQSLGTAYNGGDEQERRRRRRLTVVGKPFRFDG
jgi:hypothetical protein